MENEPEIYVIPANVTDNGNAINGNIKKKNAYEAGTILMSGAVLTFLLLSFLSIMIRAVIFTIFLILAVVAAIGIKGESLFEYILEVFFFKRKRRTMRYRLPRKEYENKKKKKKKKEEQ